MCTLLQLQVEIEAVELLMEWAWLVLALGKSFGAKCLEVMTGVSLVALSLRLSFTVSLNGSRLSMSQ